MKTEFLHLFAGAPLSLSQSIGIVAVIYGLPIVLIVFIIGKVIKNKTLEKVAKVLIVFGAALFLLSYIFSQE